MTSRFISKFIPSEFALLKKGKASIYLIGLQMKMHKWILCFSLIYIVSFIYRRYSPTSALDVYTIETFPILFSFYYVISKGTRFIVYYYSKVGTIGNNSLEFELYTDVNLDEISEVYIDDYKTTLNYKGEKIINGSPVRKYVRKSWDYLDLRTGTEYTLKIGEKSLVFEFRFKDNGSYIFPENLVVMLGVQPDIRSTIHWVNRFWYIFGMTSLVMGLIAIMFKLLLLMSV